MCVRVRVCVHVYVCICMCVCNIILPCGINNIVLAIHNTLVVQWSLSSLWTFYEINIYHKVHFLLLSVTKLFMNFELVNVL